VVTGAVAGAGDAEEGGASSRVPVGAGGFVEMIPAWLAAKYWRS
jgi:hypothetical protein